MTTYFWHDDYKGWTYTGAGRGWPTYALMLEAWLAGGKVAEPEIEIGDAEDEPDATDEELFQLGCDLHEAYVNGELKPVEPELCEDEGCPQHGTPHVCIDKSDAAARAQIGELAEELGVENKASTVFRAALDVAKSTVAAIAHPDAEAKRLYNEHTDNHPTIHSNRFPTWEELSNSSRQNWRNKASEAREIPRRNGVPIDGARAYSEGHPVEACPYSSTSSQDYEAHTRWTDDWSRAAMDDNNEADN